MKRTDLSRAVQRRSKSPAIAQYCCHSVYKLRSSAERWRQRRDVQGIAAGVDLEGEPWIGSASASLIDMAFRAPFVWRVSMRLAASRASPGPQCNHFDSGSTARPITQGAVLARVTLTPANNFFPAPPVCVLCGSGDSLALSGRLRVVFYNCAAISLFRAAIPLTFAPRPSCHHRARMRLCPSTIAGKQNPAGQGGVTLLMGHRP